MGEEAHKVKSRATRGPRQLYKMKSRELAHLLWLMVQGSRLSDAVARRQWPSARHLSISRSG